MNQNERVIKAQMEMMKLERELDKEPVDFVNGLKKQFLENASWILAG